METVLDGLVQRKVEDEERKERRETIVKEIVSQTVENVVKEFEEKFKLLRIENNQLEPKLKELQLEHEKEIHRLKEMQKQLQKSSSQPIPQPPAITKREFDRLGLPPIDQQAQMFMNQLPQRQVPRIWHVLNSTMTHSEKLEHLCYEFNSREIELITEWLQCHFPEKTEEEKKLSSLAELNRSPEQPRLNIVELSHRARMKNLEQSHRALMEKLEQSHRALMEKLEQSHRAMKNGKYRVAIEKILGASSEEDFLTRSKKSVLDHPKEQLI